MVVAVCVCVCVWGGGLSNLQDICLDGQDDVS